MHSSGKHNIQVKAHTAETLIEYGWKRCVGKGHTRNKHNKNNEQQSQMQFPGKGPEPRHKPEPTRALATQGS